MAKRITDQLGLAALSDEGFDEPVAVRYLLQLIAEGNPGRSVELRIPPYGAIQCIEGLNHRRGTPANVVEISPEVFLGLALGSTSWLSEVDAGRVHASGELSQELARVFPIQLPIDI